MYTRLRTKMFRSNKSLREICADLDIDPTMVDAVTLDMEQCDNCLVWQYQEALVDDHGSRICKFCADPPDF